MDSLVRELVDYTASAGRRGAQSRLIACLEVLVHLASADAGYIIDSCGRVVSRYAISAKEIDAVFSAECDPHSASPRIAATALLPTMTGNPLSLVLCTRGERRTIDLDFAVAFSVRMTFALRTPLSVVSAA